MSKTKHTPKPWGIYFDSQDNLVIRKMFEDGTGYQVIATCHSGFENARLIVAAPDMLEALQEIVAAADGEGWSQRDLNARQALAFRPGKESAKPVRASLGANDQSAAAAQEHQPCELFPIARA